MDLHVRHAPAPASARVLTVACAWLVAAGAPAAGARQDEAPPRRWNVLLLVVDDWNDYSGFLGGHPDAQTPKLDAFAERAVRFTHAYAQAPTCHASRTSFLSGLLPSSTGVYGNTDAIDEEPAFAEGRVQLLPTWFKANGYTTLGCGKVLHRIPGWHAASWDELVFPADVDIERGPPVVSALRELTDIGSLVFEASDEDMTEHHDALVRRKAGRWLAEEHDEPFFVALGFKSPHLPWVAPRKFFELYDPEHLTLPPVDEHDWDDLPPPGVDAARGTLDFDAVRSVDGAWRKLLHAYLACISFVDNQIGLVLRRLAESPHADDTIVVVMSDHGLHLGEKKHFLKHALWERTTRVPLLVRVPGLTPESATCEQPVGLVDLFPTLRELCELPAPPQAFDGTSLVPWLREPDRADPPHPPVATLHDRLIHVAVADGRWRYIRYRTGGEELYDHASDPLELRNLLAGDAPPETHRAEARRLAAHIPPNPHPPLR